MRTAHTSVALAAAALLPATMAQASGGGAMPACIEQAINEYENSGPCNLGDFACYCSTEHQNLLMSDMDESCVNDAAAQASMLLASFPRLSGTNEDRTRAVRQRLLQRRLGVYHQQRCSNDDIQQRILHIIVVLDDDI